MVLELAELLTAGLAGGAAAGGAEALGGEALLGGLQGDSWVTTLTNGLTSALKGPRPGNPGAALTTVMQNPGGGNAKEKSGEECECKCCEGGGDSGDKPTTKPGPKGSDWALQIYDALGRGLNSVMGALATIGSHLTEKLMEGVTSAFGKSGEGLQQIMGGVFSGVMGIAGQIFGNVSGMVRTALGFIADVPTKIAASMGGVAQSIVGGINGAMSTVAGIFSSIVDQLGQTLKILGDAAGQVISGIITVLSDAVNSTVKMSQNILGMRNSTGMTTGQAANTYFGLRAQGISANTITSMFSDPNQNPQMFGMRARAWGVQGNYTDKDFIPNLSDKIHSMREQGGPMVEFQIQAMLKDLHMDNPEMQRLVNTPSKDIKEQQAWQGKVDSAFGVSPAVLEQLGEKVSVLIGRFEYFADMAKARLTQEFLPTLEAGLDMATNFIANNADKIAAGIHAAMEWTYTTLPKLIVGGAIWVLGIVNSMMQAIAKFFGDFSQGKGVLHNILAPIAALWDMMMTGIRNFYVGAVVVWASLRRAIVDSIPTAFGARDYVQQYIQAPEAKDIKQLGIDAGNSIDTAAGTHALISAQNSAGVKSLANFSQAGADMSGAALQYMHNLDNSMGSIDSRKAYFDQETLKHQAEIARNTGETAKSLKKSISNNENPAIHAKSYVESLIVHGMRRARTR